MSYTEEAREDEARIPELTDDELRDRMGYWNSVGYHNSAIDQNKKTEANYASVMIGYRMANLMTRELYRRNGTLRPVTRDDR